MGNAFGMMFKGCAVVVGGIALLFLVIGMSAQSDLQAYNDMTPEERAAHDREMELRKAAEAKRNLVEHADGQHCINGMTGKHSQIVRYVKDRLREPDSFEHIETAIGHVNKDGQHRLRMRYRARNGFGGMSVETDFFDVANADCSFTTSMGG